MQLELAEVLVQPDNKELLEERDQLGSLVLRDLLDPQDRSVHLVSRVVPV